MTKAQFLDWSTTASSNTDIAGIGIQGTNNVNNFDDALRTLMAQSRSGLDGKMVYTVKSSGYTAVANDNAAILRFTSSATLSLTAAATLAANWHIILMADGGDITIDPNASETIDGKTTRIIPNGSSALVLCDGSNFLTYFDSSRWRAISYVTPSAAAVVFTNLDPYINLRLRGFLYPSSAGEIGIQYSTDNGSSWISGASSYRTQATGSNGATVGSVLNTTSFIKFSNGQLINNSAANGMEFTLDIGGFNQAQRCRCVWNAYAETSTTMFQLSGVASEDGTTARNALRFLSGASTFTGRLLLEGSRG